MKLDKVGAELDWARMSTGRQCKVLIKDTIQDGSGTIERDEFLSLPQVSSNPLAQRYALNTQGRFTKA